MSRYTPWIAPVTTDYDALSWRQADALLKEIVRRTPERIEALEAYVCSTPGYEDWRTDGSEGSLKPLGPWLLRVLKTRWLSRDEKHFEVLNPRLAPEAAEIAAQNYLNTPVWEFTVESDAVLMDVSLYMATLLHRANPTTMWARCKSKNDYSFNSPLLALIPNYGFGLVGQASKPASRMIDRVDGPDAVYTHYTIWDRKAKLTESRRAKWPRPSST